MNNGMEQAQRLTQVWGWAAVGLYSFLSFPFCLVYCSAFSFVSGGEGKQWGGSAIWQARPEAEGIFGPVILTLECILYE